MTLSDRLDPLNLGDDLRGRLLVLEVGAAGEDARAIGAADNDFHLPSSGGRHEALQCALMVEQRVAPGQQKAVGIGLCQIQCQFAGLNTVHTETPSLNDALLTQPS